MQTIRVLVVDDDPAMTELVAEHLRTWSWEPAVASSVDEAVALLEARAFDVVLSDLQMPLKNGLELLRLVRENWPDTPVILFSSFAAQETTRQALEAGARRFLSKPFSRQVLREALESEVRRESPP